MQTENKKKESMRVLPEGCEFTNVIRGARFRIAHITRDALGNFNERYGWLCTDIVCKDESRVCIQYDNADVLIDVPGLEIAVIGCRPFTN